MGTEEGFLIKSLGCDCRHASEETEEATSFSPELKRTHSVNISAAASSRERELQMMDRRIFLAVGIIAAIYGRCSALGKDLCYFGNLKKNGFVFCKRYRFKTEVGAAKRAF